MLCFVGNEIIDIFTSLNNLIKKIDMAINKSTTAAKRKDFKTNAKAYVKSTTPGAGNKVVKKLSKSIRKDAQATQGTAKASARKTSASNRKTSKGVSLYNTGSSKLGRKVNRMK
jgi:hypothetical protein